MTGEIVKNKAHSELHGMRGNAWSRSARASASVGQGRESGMMYM